MGGVLKKRGGVFCPGAHKKVTASQINPLSIVQPLMTSDPPFLSQCCNCGRGRRRQSERGKHTHPESAVTKGGPQPQLDEPAWRASGRGHLHKAEPPEAAHLQGLARFPATLLHKRCVSAQTHTREVEKERYNWGLKERCCLPITDWPLSPPQKDSLILAQTTGLRGPPVRTCGGILWFIANINGKLNILRSKTEEEGILVFYWWMV